MAPHLHPSPSSRLPLAKLPFVGPRRDGAQGYWTMPAGAGAAILGGHGLGRTYAAWFLLYAEVNGQAIARALLDAIEREMPSCFPAVDRAFLGEIAGRGYARSAA
ncbi:MAG: hypothetical protein PW843_22650 [Azospirillaceae bacterium]|nr:hypothetical protein [Azospirillaceae bacterium]